MRTTGTTLTSDYINASWVSVPEAERAYIVGQGPLENTVGEFWTMIWQNNVKAIVMLCNTFEDDMDKCARYWPVRTKKFPSGKDLMITESFLKISLISVKVDGEFLVRTMIVQDDKGRSRTITQYHYLSWSDNQSPEDESKNSFIAFVNKISRDHPSTFGAPNVVHCSAGIGRSGTYCLIDSCLALMDKTRNPITESKVVAILIHMRKQRHGLVKTPGQLQFTFRILAKAIVDMDMDDMDISDDEEDSSSSSQGKRKGLCPNCCLL